MNPLLAHTPHLICCAAFLRRLPGGPQSSYCQDLCLCVTHCVCHITSIIVKNIIIIEVEVDELHEGKILSRPSMSMTISAVALENKKNNERLS